MYVNQDPNAESNGELTITNISNDRIDGNFSFIGYPGGASGISPKTITCTFSDVPF